MPSPYGDPLYVPNRLIDPVVFTAAGDYTMNTSGIGSVVFSLGGSPSAISATFQGTLDGTNWYTLTAYPVSGGPSVVTISALSGQTSYRVNTIGLATVRVHIGTLTGTVTVKADGGAFSGAVIANAPGSNAKRILSAASTNAQTVRITPTILYGLSAINTTSTVYYLKLYNLAAAPTLSSDVPVMTIPLLGTATFSQSAPYGINFSTGLAMALTGALSDTDTTVAATGVVLNFMTL